MMTAALAYAAPVCSMWSKTGCSISSSSMRGSLVMGDGGKDHQFIAGERLTFLLPPAFRRRLCGVSSPAASSIR